MKKRDVILKMARKRWRRGGGGREGLMEKGEGGRGRGRNRGVGVEECMSIWYACQVVVTPCS